MYHRYPQKITLNHKTEELSLICTLRAVVAHRASIIWIYDNPDSYFHGDRCFTCGVEQDCEALVGQYSRHTRDCEYAPKSSWVQGHLQESLDAQRMDEIKQRERFDKNLENENKKIMEENKRKNSLIREVTETPNLRALKSFGIKFARLIVTFNAEEAVREIEHYEDWLKRFNGEEGLDENWVPFLNNYVSKLRVQLASNRGE